MARGSSLSNDRIIDYINEHYVEVDINISDVGFPPDTPALKPWQKAYHTHAQQIAKDALGFSTSVVISPDGAMPLGTVGSGYHANWTTATMYNPCKYLAFLKRCLARHQAICNLLQTNLPSAKAFTQREKIRSEIIQEVYELNRRY